MSASLRPSILDQSPAPEGSTGAQALHNTLDLARLADEEARRLLASSSRMSFELLRRGELIAVPSPERALRFLASEEGERGEPGAARPGAARRAVLGAPSAVRDELEWLARAHGAEEVIVAAIAFDHRARRRSYELLAEAFALEPRASPRTPAGA